jgi:hypothetical protein
VNAVVKKVVGKEPWRPRLDDICPALDEEQISCPRPWKRRGIRDWTDASVTERGLAKNAIAYRLKIAGKLIFI